MDKNLTLLTIITDASETEASNTAKLIGFLNTAISNTLFAQEQSIHLLHDPF